MITSTSKVSHTALEAELRDLQHVDWSGIWSGPPQPGTPEFQRWLERYGWKNETVENNLEVITRNGNELDLESNGFWRPVFAITIGNIWRGQSNDFEEKQTLVSQGVTTWGEYVRTVSEIYGSPTWAGPGYAEDFPEPPYADLWRKASSPQDNPYRMAYWASPDIDHEKPIILLTQGVSLRTWDTQGGGGSVVDMEFRSPEPVYRDG